MSDRSHIWITRALALGLFAFAIYYPYKFLATMVPFDFGGPEAWQNHWMIDPDAPITAAWQALHFFIWVPSVLATEAMLLAALWLTVLLMRGVTFDGRVVRMMQAIGLLAVLAAALWLAAAPFDSWMLTAFNAENVRPIRFLFDSGEIGLGIAGLGVFLLARVLHVTVLLDRENQEMI